MKHSDARFFCENCGAEVNRDTGRCPSCGRVFASVRCPACGFTGGESLFREGCPVCGYCAPPETPDNAPARPFPLPDRRARGTRKKSSLWFPASSLAPWVYVLAVFALIAVAAALFFTF
ncbi:MAG: hypothetical protein LBH35_04010 [Treponema sp.]|jgi:predicted RNA-binding Zn-ribbon protein involved in translation (DUF1610 family)|nr:hypothetical protein [Treponema sp.]